MANDICAAGDAETERNLIQLDESVEAVEYLAEPLQVAVSAVSVPLSEKVTAANPTLIYIQPWPGADVQLLTSAKSWRVPLLSCTSFFCSRLTGLQPPIELRLPRCSSCVSLCMFSAWMSAQLMGACWNTRASHRAAEN